MKKVLIILIFFISTPLIAKERFDGKVILCSKITSDYREPNIDAFHYNDNSIDHYYYSNALNEFEERGVIFYDTTFARIIFDGAYSLDRASLELHKIGEKERVLLYKECEIIETNDVNSLLAKTLDNLIKQIRQNNKI